MDLNLLENKIKKDPGANFDFFNHKWNEFVTLFEIIKLTPHVYNSDFIKLLQFITNTIAFYNKGPDVDQLLYGSHSNHASTSKSTPTTATNSLINANATNSNSTHTSSPTRLDLSNPSTADGRWLCLKLIEIIKELRNSMDPKMLKMIVKSTFALRTKKQIDLETILIEWLDLLDLNDREQRKKLYNYIVKDLVLLSSKSKNKQVIKKIQRMLFDKINKSGNLNIRLLSCCIVIELYRRSVWNDLYTLNQLCELCKSQNAKVALSAIYFLLSAKNHYNVTFDTIDASSAQSGSSGAHAAGGGSGSGDKNSTANGEAGADPTPVSHSLSHILDIYEPFKLVELLLERCAKNHFQYQHKLVALKLAAVLINKHRLTVPSFYTYLSKYLHHKQPLVTRVLLSLVIASYSGLDVGIVSPLVRRVVDDFVAHDRSEDTIAIGLNTIREICTRMPEVITEDTLNYLVEFRNYKSKNVSASVKSLINTYRKLDPGKLSKATRGKEANVELIRQKRKLISSKKSLGSSKSDAEDEESDDDDAMDDVEDGSKQQFGDDALNLNSDADSDEVPQLVEVSSSDLAASEDDSDSEQDEDSDEGYSNEEDEYEDEDDGDDQNLSDDQEEGDQGESESESDVNDQEDGENDDNESNKSSSESESDADSIVGMDESRLLYTSKKKLRSHQKLENKIAKKKDKFSARKLAQSKKGSKQSLTNKIKQRNKPLLMTLQSRRVKKKRNMSVTEQMSRLKRHIRGLSKGNAKKKQRRHH